MRKLSYFYMLIVYSMLSTATAAEMTKIPPEARSLAEAFKQGTHSLDVRYRYEFVDQDGLPKEAKASTLRTRVSYVTGAYEGFKAGVEVDNITPIGAERYNDTINGKMSYPIVADAQITSINQAYLSYQGLPKTNITVGRQVFNLDNQRFIGSVEWRQNNQTFDAASFSSDYIEHAKLFYAYVDRVNRVFGDDSPAGTFRGNSHLINGSYEFNPALKVTAYSYLLDFDNAATSSSATYGGRLTGKYPLSEHVNLSYAAEGAHQVDYGKNPTNTDENYYLIEPAITVHGITGKLGYEVLEGNGTVAFQTPLATLHAFNGWADKFLVTPANGLEDTYVSLGYKIPSGNEYLKGMEFAVAYHQYDANRGGADYGSEWNASVSQTWRKHYTAGLKFAQYEADRFATDTTKVMTWLQIKY